ncbi:MAG: hypothetical protein QM713_11685 [Arachnia sp.]
MWEAARITRRSALALALAPLALAGCTPATTSGGSSGASWIQAWDTYEAVLADTVAVVIATATGQTQISSVADGSGAKDTTLTEFAVERSLGQQLETVAVRNSGGFAPEEAAQYEIGRKYLLFLAPFVFAEGEDTGTYIAVGQLAAYRVDGDRATRLTTRDALPREATVDELLAVAEKLG